MRLLDLVFWVPINVFVGFCFASSDRCVCWIWFFGFRLMYLLGLVLQVPIGTFFGFGFGLAGEDQ